MENKIMQQQTAFNPNLDQKYTFIPFEESE